MRHNLGGILKQYRLDAKLTQVQAAEMIGAAVRTWQDWEAGRRNIPPAKYRLFVILLYYAKVAQP